MKHLFRLAPLFLVITFFFQACSDSSVQPEDDVIEEKKEEILERVSTILPDNLIVEFENQIESESANVNVKEYLDTLNISLIALVDSINKYSSLSEFKLLMQDAQTEVNKLLTSTYGKEKSSSCSNNLGLGFSKGGEVYGEVSAGIGAGVISQLSARGGGGVEFIYDFVNLDRGVYTYSFCGIGAANVGLGAGFSASVGFTGLRKWLFNIKPNQLSIQDRFEGAGRAYSFGVSGSVYYKIGLEASADIAFIQETQWHGDQGGFFRNLLSCPAYFSSPPIRGGLKEVSFSLSGGTGLGAEVMLALKGELIGVYRTFVDVGYTNYGVDRWGRLVAGARMGAELLGIEPVSNIKTGGSAPLAAAMVTLLSLFNPSDCPPPIQVPYVENIDFLEADETTAIFRVNIIDDGGASITDRGLCWSIEPFPTREDECKTEGNGIGEFVSTIDGLNPGAEYYVRAFASNEMGTNYSEQLQFQTKPDISKPTINTEPVTSITANSAVSGGTIIDDGGADITARGVCWSTSHNPDLNDSCITTGSGVGKFTSNISGLFPNRQYYLRAYATNEAGTGYGNQINFTTDDGIDDVPPGVNDFMSPEDKQTLQDNGLEIYTGLNPPNIEGNYYANSLTTSDGNIDFMNYSYRFHDQTAELSIRSSHISENGTDTAEGKGAFIAGSGTTFSIYMESISEIRQETHVTTIESARIYSGIISSDGIINFQFGFIITDKKNDINDLFMNVGDTRVIYESDGLAERVNDFPFSPKIISPSEILSIYLKY